MKPKKESLDFQEELMGGRWPIRESTFRIVSMRAQMTYEWVLLG